MKNWWVLLFVLFLVTACLPLSPKQQRALSPEEVVRMFYTSIQERDSRTASALVSQQWRATYKHKELMSELLRAYGEVTSIDVIALSIAVNGDKTQATYEIVLHVPGKEIRDAGLLTLVKEKNGWKITNPILG